MPWKNVAGYDVMEQASGFSCGMACVAMLMKLAGLGNPTESSVKQLSKDVGGEVYKASLADKPYVGGPRMLTATSAPVMDSDAGTGMANLSAVLTSARVANTCSHYSDVTGEIARTPRDKPMIAHIQWGNGTGHFIVLQYVDGKQLFRDPAGGLVNSKTNDRTYPPGGQFSGWLIKST